MTERTIRITGRGKIAVRPDTVRLLITQTETFPEYAQAAEEASQKKNQLDEVLGALGFSKEDLKTRHFEIETVYESYQDKEGKWRKRLEGYKYEHRMKLDFKRDNELMGKVLYALAHCPGQPEFDICFTTSDPEKVKNELLGKAVEDARIKAEVLTKAAGVTLGDIQAIDYSWGEIELVTPRLGNSFCCEGNMAPKAMAYDMDIEPDDIDAEETVTVVWEIR